MEITTSPNVSNFDFTVAVDTSGAVPQVTVADISIYIGAGASNIVGIALKMIDPDNLIFHQTIAPSVDMAGLGSFTKNMPFFGDAVKPGTYKFYATLIDQDLTEYVWTEGLAYKTVFVCKPNSLAMSKGSWGGLLLNVDPNCELGELIVQDGGTGFVYGGKTPSNTETSLIITYPVDSTGTVIAPEATFIPFILPLVLTGAYTIQGKVIQTYQLTDTTSITVAYYYYKTFSVECGYSLCKALCDYERLEAEVKACSFGRNIQDSLQKIKQLLLFVSLLTKVREFKNCGKNFGSVLDEIQKIGDFSCDCPCLPTGISPSPLTMGGGTLVLGTLCGDIDLTLVKFGNNVKINASDVTYNVSVSSGSADFVTITPISGTCSKTFQIDIDLEAMLAQAAFEICISNTLFVTKSPCGDDTTAVVGSLTHKYSSIKGAVKDFVSDSGMCIWVWNGTWDENKINFGSDGIEKTGLNFFFSPGTIANSTGDALILTTAVTGKITIRGGAILQGTGGAAGLTGTIIRNSVDYEYDIECLSIDSYGLEAVNNTIAFNAGTLRLKCSKVTAAGNSCFDVRVGASTGYVTCDLIDNSSSTQGAAAVHFKDNTVAGTKWIFNVKQNNSNATGFFQNVCMDTGNSGDPLLEYYGDIHNVATTAGAWGGGVGAAGNVVVGTIIYQGNVITDNSWGSVCNGSKMVILDGSRIVAGGDYSALLMSNPLGTGISILGAVQLINNSTTVATISFSAANVGIVDITGARMKNKGSSGDSPLIQMTNISQRINLNNCLMQSASGAGISIKTAFANDTRLINTWANVASGGGGVLNDLIQTLNVDSSLVINVYP